MSIELSEVQREKILKGMEEVIAVSVLLENDLGTQQDFLSANAVCVIKEISSDIRDMFILMEKHVVAVVVADDLDRGVALVAQILGAPLAQSVAGHVPAVAVGGKNGLAHTGTGEKIGENGVHQSVDIGIDVPAVDPFLVVGGGGGDGKVVALVPVQ